MIELIEQHQSQAWPARYATGAPLAAVEGALGSRFHLWRTADGRRVVCTVFARLDALDCLEEMDAAIVIGVGVDRFGLARIVCALGPDDRREARDRMREASAAGAYEWHVHMLCPDRGSAVALAEALRAPT